MVYLKLLYSRLDRLAQCQSSPFSMEAQQEHVKMTFFQNVICFYQKISGLKNIGFIQYTDICVDPRSSGGHFSYCLLIFKACRMEHPNFEILSIGFFASNVIKTAFIVQECI